MNKKKDICKNERESYRKEESRKRKTAQQGKGKR